MCPSRYENGCGALRSSSTINSPTRSRRTSSSSIERRCTLARLIANGCGDKGLSVGEKAVVSLDYLDARDAIFGAVAKDSSYLYVGDAAFSNVDFCFAAYRKKQEFDGARIEYGASINDLCAADRMQVQTGSVVSAAGR